MPNNGLFMKILVSPTKTMAFDKTPVGLSLEMGRPGFEPEADTLDPGITDPGFWDIEKSV